MPYKQIIENYTVLKEGLPDFLKNAIDILLETQKNNDHLEQALIALNHLKTFGLLDLAIITQETIEKNFLFAVNESIRTSNILEGLGKANLLIAPLSQSHYEKTQALSEKELVTFLSLLDKWGQTILFENEICAAENFSLLMACSHKKHRFTFLSKSYVTKMEITALYFDFALQMEKPRYFANNAKHFQEILNHDLFENISIKSLLDIFKSSKKPTTLINSFYFSIFDPTTYLFYAPLSETGCRLVVNHKNPIKLLKVFRHYPKTLATDTLKTLISAHKHPWTVCHALMIANKGYSLSEAEMTAIIMHHSSWRMALAVCLLKEINHPLTVELKSQLLDSTHPEKIAKSILDADDLYFTVFDKLFKNKFQQITYKGAPFETLNQDEKTACIAIVLLLLSKNLTTQYRVRKIDAASKDGLDINEQAILYAEIVKESTVLLSGILKPKMLSRALADKNFREEVKRVNFDSKEILLLVAVSLTINANLDKDTTTRIIYCLADSSDFFEEVFQALVELSDNGIFNEPYFNAVINAKSSRYLEISAVLIYFKKMGLLNQSFEPLLLNTITTTNYSPIHKAVAIATLFKVNQDAVRPRSIWKALAVKSSSICASKLIGFDNAIISACIDYIEVDCLRAEILALLINNSSSAHAIEFWINQLQKVQSLTKIKESLNILINNKLCAYVNFLRAISYPMPDILALLIQINQLNQINMDKIYDIQDERLSLVFSSLLQRLIECYAFSDESTATIRFNSFIDEFELLDDNKRAALTAFPNHRLTWEDFVAIKESKTPAESLKYISPSHYGRSPQRDLFFAKPRLEDEVARNFVPHKTQ